MVTDRDAAINLRLSRAVRDSLLAKLRARRTTMGAFLADMMELVDSDEEFLNAVEMKRLALGRERARRLVTESLADIPAPGSRVLVASEET